MLASPPAPSFTDQAIAALRAGNKARGAELLSQAILADPNGEQAWLWLSAIVTSPAERRFCLERVQAINPQNAAAQQGLASLPAGTSPPSITPTNGQASTTCTFPGCHAPITKAGHIYCHPHWKAIYRPPARPTQRQRDNETQTATLVSAEELTQRLTLPDRNVNLLLVELGWITKEQQGWKVTPQGSALGAVQRFDTQTGAPYVLWPEAIVTNRVLLSAKQSLNGHTPNTAASDASFRDKFPAELRTTDGHLVRSKAELLIDNWLYMAGLVHAYSSPTQIVNCATLGLRPLARFEPRMMEYSDELDTSRSACLPE